MFNTLRAFLEYSNADALGLSHEDAAIKLATYKLSKSQRDNHELVSPFHSNAANFKDIINGYHFYDGTERLVILEGLKSGNLVKLLNMIAPYDFFFVSHHL